MNEVPQVPRKSGLWKVLQQTVPYEDRSHLREATFTGIFAFLCYTPTLPWPDRGFIGYGGDGWALWPPLLLTVVLTACLLDDHLERSPRDRVLAVLLQLGIYFAGTAMFLAIVHEESISSRAIVRTFIATMPLQFAFGSSRTLVKWKHRSEPTRYDRFGSPYLR